MILRMKKKYFILLLVIGFILFSFSSSFASAEELSACYGEKLASDVSCDHYIDECANEGEAPFEGPGSGYFFNSSGGSFTQCYDQYDRCIDRGLCDGCSFLDQDLKNAIEKLEFVYDEDYVNTTKETRLFDPHSQPAPTPFDKMKVKIKIKKEYEYCLGRLNGTLYHEDSENPANNAIVYSGIFYFSPMLTLNDEHVYYEMVVDADPMAQKAWTDDADLLDKVINKGSIKIIVKKEDSAIDDPNNYVDTKKIGACLRLWGPDGNVEYEFQDVDDSRKLKKSKAPAAFKFVSILLGSDKNALDLIKYAEQGKHGFDTIDPFKSYKTKFSHEVDLKKYSSNNIDKIDVRLSFALFAQSSCPGAEIYSIYTLTGANTDNGHSQSGGGYIAVSSTNNFRYLKDIIVHETAHAFCGLADEYSPDQSYAQRQCVAPKDGLPYFLPYGRMYLGCDEHFNIRSSKTSIMGSPEDASNFTLRPFKFNVVGCSFCRAPILNKGTGYAKSQESLNFSKENLDCIYEAPTQSDPTPNTCDSFWGKNNWFNEIYPSGENNNKYPFCCKNGDTFKGPGKFIPEKSDAVCCPPGTEAGSWGESYYCNKGDNFCKSVYGSESQGCGTSCCVSGETCVGVAYLGKVKKCLKSIPCADGETLAYQKEDFYLCCNDQYEVVKSFGNLKNKESKYCKPLSDESCSRKEQTLCGGMLKYKDDAVCCPANSICVHHPDGTPFCRAGS